MNPIEIILAAIYPQYRNLDGFAQSLLLLAICYPVAFFAIRFIVFLLMTTGVTLRGRSPDALSCLLAVILWPSVYVVGGYSFDYASISRADLHEVYGFFIAWIGFTLLMSLATIIPATLALILYLTKKQPLSSRFIYLSVIVMLLIECAYLFWVSGLHWR